MEPIDYLITDICRAAMLHDYLSTTEVAEKLARQNTPPEDAWLQANAGALLYAYRQKDDVEWNFGNSGGRHETGN